MALSWAAECFAFLASGRDRAPEKRKVGSSTLPLTTSSEQRKRLGFASRPSALGVVGLSFGLISLCVQFPFARLATLRNSTVHPRCCRAWSALRGGRSP